MPKRRPPRRVKPTFTTITAPAYWSSFLVNGDASGLSDDEYRRAKQWLAENNHVRIFDVKRVNGEPVDPHFTNNYRLYDPSASCTAGEVLEYDAEEIPEKDRHVCRDRALGSKFCSQCDKEAAASA